MNRPNTAPRRHMVIEFHGENCATVRFGNKAVLFSYSMPVAAWIEGETGMRRYAITDPPSRTTARHISQHGPAVNRGRVGPEGSCELVTADQLDQIISQE